MIKCIQKVFYLKAFKIISKTKKKEVPTYEQKLESIALNGSSKLSEESLINKYSDIFQDAIWNWFLFFNKLAIFKTVIKIDCYNSLRIWLYALGHLIWPSLYPSEVVITLPILQLKKLRPSEGKMTCPYFLSTKYKASARIPFFTCCKAAMLN